jgi:hypothetical protein
MSSRLLTSLKIGAVSCLILLLPACSVNVQKDKNGQDKKVDIRTPIGNIKVDNSADARDTGLPLYPGARLRQKEDDGNDKSANVNLSFGEYGLKVVAVQYESDDPPEKLIAYYQAELKKYGKVLECHVHRHGEHFDVHSNHDSGNSPLTCEEDGGPAVELKVGTRQNQRIVAIDPKDKGCTFALVRVQTHDEDTI